SVRLSVMVQNREAASVAPPCLVIGLAALSVAGRLTVSTYSPCGSTGKAKWPLSSVLVLATAPEAENCAPAYRPSLTSTPLSGAPLVLAVGVCAATVVASINNIPVSLISIRGEAMFDLGILILLA